MMSYNKAEDDIMNIPSELRDILDSNPEIISGAVRFKGTRVPVQALLEVLEGSGNIEEFLEGWPDVPRAHAEAVLRWEQHQAREVFGLDLAS